MAAKQIHDDEPSVGNDPMDLPQQGIHKKIIAPDPKKVREAEQRKKARSDEKPGVKPGRSSHGGS